MSDRATETTTIAAPPEVVRGILLDFPRYPEWVKDLKAVEVRRRDDQGRGTEVHFRAAGMGRSTQYTLSYDLSDPHVIAWVQTEGDITRKLDGRYVLAEGADGGTDITYELEVELVVPLPSFVKRRSQHKIIHAALRDLKAFAEQAGR